jgi:uncharacterized damage-inducible protein DinB
VSETHSDNSNVGRAYLAAGRRKLAYCHERITHCLNQLDDARVWWRPQEGMNSVANIVLHLCGNLRQWIVSGVGGAPDVRDRPAEFAERGSFPRAELQRRLDAVVAEADAVLAGTDEAVLLDARTVQGFAETVLSAIFDTLAHLNGHMQEIVYITRLLLGERYKFAWIPSPAQGGLPAAETVALRDAAFTDMPAHPLNPEIPIAAVQIPIPPTVAGPAAGGVGKAPPVEAKGDYLRELEQEFQDEEDEGKVK